jgi:hypothetical protein
MLLLPRPASAAWPSDPLVNLPVCTAAGDQIGPTAVTDGMGGVVIAWTGETFTDGGNTRHFDIYVQHVLASGIVDPAWRADGEALSNGPWDQGYPAIVADGAGGAIVTWEDGYSVGILAQHILGSGLVDPAWPGGGYRLGSGHYPYIVTDGLGGAIVSWHTGTNNTNSDVYAQHVLASGGVDPSWPVGGQALCTAPGDQFIAISATDGAGGAIVTWLSGAYPYPEEDIYAQHVLASGAIDTRWPVNGRVLCGAPGRQSYSKMPVVEDGAGGAIDTWDDGRSGTNYDVYAQHVLASGAVDPAWPTNGRALCTAPGDQTAPVTVGDGAGGAIVAWSDNRNSSSYDIYAQHVLSNGVVDPGWPGDGRALCIAAGDQGDATIVSDGASGAIVTWDDKRGGSNHDIYAQHVLANGAVDPAWPVDGRAMCTAANDQVGPTVVSDNQGGAIVTWMDNRNSPSSDIYAQRVLANGQLGGDFPTAALASLVSAEVRASTVQLRWYLSLDHPATLTVYRSNVGGLWQSLGTVTPDGSGYVHYDDANVVAGTRYGYRLGLRSGGGEVFAGEAWVEVPPSSADQAVLVPTPVTAGEVTVSFAAPVGHAVRVSLFDLAGRLVASQQVVGGSARQSVGLARSNDLAPGVYLVRVELDRPVVARVAVIR